MPPSTSPFLPGPPVHCPAWADAFDRLHDMDVDAACTERGRAARHRALKAKENQVAQWLSDLKDDLDAATTHQLQLTGADPRRDPLVRQDLDPSTAHVLMGLARRGVNRAPAVYVSLVCQRVDAVWHGVAGAYVAVCTCSSESNGRAAAERLAQALPAEAAPIATARLPVGLRPRPGWWESRLRTAHRLYPRSGRLWTMTDLHAVALPRGNAALIRTGPRTTSESNLLYIDDQEQIDALAPLLADPDGPALAVVRVGHRQLLRRLAGDDGQAVQPALLDPSGKGRHAPVGWSVVEHSGAAEVTRSGGRLARRLAVDLPDGSLGPRLWTAPRLSQDGAVDGPGLVRLLAELAGRAPQTG